MCECIMHHGKVIHSPDCPELQAKQHKWHKEIKAWADGALIAYRPRGGVWSVTSTPDWNNDDLQFQVYKQPKPDFIKTVLLRVTESWKHVQVHVQWEGELAPAGYAHNLKLFPAVRLTFDGETGDLKDAEVVK